MVECPMGILIIDQSRVSTKYSVVSIMREVFSLPAEVESVESKQSCCLMAGAHGCIQRLPRAPGRVPGRAPLRLTTHTGVPASRLVPSIIGCRRGKRSISDRSMVACDQDHVG